MTPQGRHTQALHVLVWVRLVGVRVAGVRGWGCERAGTGA